MSSNFNYFYLRARVSLHIETQSGLQEQKIENLNVQLSDRRAYILDLKRQIVALEYKCENQERTLGEMDDKIEKTIYDKIIGNEQLQGHMLRKAELQNKFDPDPGSLSHTYVLFCFLFTYQR